MWGGIDLSAIGGAVGEALKNAQRDLDKGVSNALGIDSNKEETATGTLPSEDLQNGWPRGAWLKTAC